MSLVWMFDCTCVHVHVHVCCIVFSFIVSGYPSTIAPPVDAQDEAVRRYGLTPQSEIVNEALQGGGVNGCSQEAPTTTSHASGNENINQQSHITNGK